MRTFQAIILSTTLTILTTIPAMCESPAADRGSSGKPARTADSQATVTKSNQHSGGANGGKAATANANKPKSPPSTTAATQKVVPKTATKPPAKTTSAIRTATPDGKPIWLKKIKDGLAAAKSSGKFILIDFYTDWCHFCHKLDQEVYQTEPVSPYLAQNFVCVRLNAEDGGEGQSLAQKLGIHGYPTSVFLDSSGGYISNIPGFLPPNDYLAKLQEADAARKKGVKGQPVLSQ